VPPSRGRNMSPRTISVLLVLWFGPAATAQAQGASPSQPPPPVEIWGGFAGLLATTGGAIESAYAPALAAGTRLDSSATQTLAVDTEFAPGFEAGVNVFFSRHAGVQFFVARTRADLGGTNGPYAVRLRYVSQAPPDYLPREVVYTNTAPWPDTTGVLRDTAIGTGAVVRFRGRRGGVAGTLAGGVSFHRCGGEIDRLGFTQFRLGGHSVLFGFDYPVVVGPRPDWSAAPYLGGQLDLGAGTVAALTLGIRVDPRGTRDVPIEVIRLANEADAAAAPPIAEIQRQLALPPLRLDGVRWQVVLGLKVRP